MMTDDDAIREKMIDWRGELADTRARAAHIGTRIVIGADDRPSSIFRGPTIHEVVWADPRGSLACPTCEDGMRTIASPQRCRQCVLGGL